MGQDGEKWANSLEQHGEAVQELMKLTPNKRRFYLQGIRAATLMRSTLQASLSPPRKKFEEFVRENRDKTQKEMAQLWGDEATQQNISYACKKLGITRKKTYCYQEIDE